MNIQASNSTLRIETAGATALRALSCSQEGTVLASMTHAVYLLNSQGDLCWLVPPTGPMHVRALRLSSPVPHLTVSSRYLVSDNTLEAESDVTLDLRFSSFWSPPAFPSGNAAPMPIVSRHIMVLGEELCAQHMPVGLGCLVPSILGMSGDLPRKPDFTNKDRMAEKAWPVIKGILLASATGHRTLWLNRANSLVGLGEGLTPSGDDFLGGFLFARYILGRQYSSKQFLSDHEVSSFIEQAKSLTNLISHSILQDHARGYTVEPLHQLAISMLHGESASQLLPFAKQILLLGHSSGWDLLTGFLAGVLAIIAQYDYHFSTVYRERNFNGYQTEDRTG